MRGDQGVQGIVSVLERTYGTPRHGNKDDPLNELIYIKLSQQTNAPKFEPLYEALHCRFPAWEGLAEALPEELEKILRPLGLQRRRARDLRAMAGAIAQQVGELELGWLRDLTPADAIEYLQSLPGVGIKTAYCVAMYSLGHDILPVDVHVQRVSERLGLLPKGLSDEAKHEWMHTMIPAGKRYSYHVNCVSHGRTVCRKKPRCAECCLRQYCDCAGSGDEA